MLAMTFMTPTMELKYVDAFYLQVQGLKSHPQCIFSSRKKFCNPFKDFKPAQN